MRITQHTDYALRVLMYVGGNAGRLVTIAQIAERFGISRAHLMKVVNRLVRAGFLSGKRGKGGGLSLAQAPSRIRIGEVFRAMEGDPGASSRRGRAGQAPAADALEAALGHALQAFLAVLDHHTLADLLAEPVPARLVTMMRAQPSSVP